MAKFSRPTPPPDNETPLKRVFKSIDGKWAPMNPNDLLETKLGYFLTSPRMMLEFIYDKKQYFICCSNQDYTDLKVKYPKAIVIHLNQIIRMFTGNFSLDEEGNYLFKSFPAVLKVLTQFDGTSVVLAKTELNNH